MKASANALELLAIAAITTGCGLLLHTIFPGQTAQQWFALACILALVIFFIIKKWSSKQMIPHSLWVNKDMRTTLAGASQQPQILKQGAAMSEITRYFAWIEKKLQELVVREGLECGLVRIKRGPLVITLQLRLINPTQRDLQKLMKLGPALAQLLQVETVRIADTARGVMIEMPSPQPVTPNGALLAGYSQRMRVAIGVDFSAQPIAVNLQDHGALFWVGPSRRGKTQSMKSVLYALIRGNIGYVQFIIIASPAKVRKDWGVFASVGGCLGIACTDEDIRQAIQWAVKEMKSATSYAQGIHTILIVDDLPNILKAVPEITGSLAEVAGMGAGLGIHLLVGTQGAGSKSTSGGTEIENNVTARILYRPATSRAGSQSAGTGGLALHQLSSTKGDALALVDGHTTRIATAWIDDREIALLPARDSQPLAWEKDRPVGKIIGRRPENNPEPPKTGQNNREAAQNRLEQPRTTFAAHSIQHEPVRNGHPTVQPSEHIPEQSLEQDGEQPRRVSIEEYLQQLAQLSIDELKQNNLGFDATRFPTPDEQRMILAAYGLTLSVRKTCFMAYGHYNGKVRDYVKPIIAGVSEVDDELTESTEADAQKALPDSIDLTTPEGRALLEKLQKLGFIKWPDAHDLLEDQTQAR